MKQLIAFFVFVLIALGAVYGRSKTTLVDPPIGNDTIQAIMPGKNFVDDRYGKETFLGVGPVTGVGEYNANGVATMNGFEDESLFVGMQINIQVAPDGSFYEAWLVDSNGDPHLSVGHLTNGFGDVRHSVSKQFKQVTPSKLEIVITQEKDDGNPAPSSNRVAGAVLTERSR